MLIEMKFYYFLLRPINLAHGQERGAPPALLGETGPAGHSQVQAPAAGAGSTALVNRTPPSGPPSQTVPEQGTDT